MLSLRRRSISRLLFFAALFFFVYVFFFSSSSSLDGAAKRKRNGGGDYQIKEHNFIERATRPDKSLNVQNYPFLQARIGRDERDDIFNDLIYNGQQDYWERFQMPYIVNKETNSMDTQHILSAIDQLLSLNGWVGHLCPTLTRPFGQHKRISDTSYDDLIRSDHLYYVSIIIHSADHFLVDQLAVIVQMARRLGTNNLFVSMLDYDSRDSTETLLDLSEAVLTLLGVPFRIRRVSGMTEEPNSAYYPLEEAHMRNLALEPLHELKQRRGIEFARVVWLKGFTCPNDILETIKISFENEAAMVCGMDWAEHNGFFIFSDRWRTRDIEGDQFRQSKSNSKPDAVPPRDKLGAKRYQEHLPFQVFCCESGTHVVDPKQSYYRGIKYRSGTDYVNVTKGEVLKERKGDADCLDSSQAWFCRDLWVRSALEGVEETDRANAHGGGKRRRGVVEYASSDPLMKKREAADSSDKKMDGRDAVKVQVGSEEEEVSDDAADTRKKQGQKDDLDANAGSDYDAMPEDNLPPLLPDDSKVSRPNSVYRPARILVNPRCPTTYAGVSHTKLSRDLFGEGDDDEKEGEEGGKRYVLEDWEGAPESFVCQEQRQTGGRKATKTQRRLGFSIDEELQKLANSEDKSAGGITPTTIMSSYFANANNVVAKKMAFNTYISDGDALQFLYNHSARGAMHDSDERFPPPLCHPGTRQAVVARITEWYGYLTGPQKRIMWVHAPAGYGKTAIAGTISKILEEQEGLDFCPLGATFFFWRTSPDRNSPAYFIITIAYQLATSIPELKSHVEDAIKKNPMILSKALEIQLVKLIVEPFKALGEYVQEMPNRLIIVDGIDECINSNHECRVEKRYAEDQEKVQIRVLDLIYALQSQQLPLSFLLLSRPESWIKQQMGYYPWCEATEALDLYELGDHMNDVEAYVRPELSRIAARIGYQKIDGDEEWPGENLVLKFVVRTNGHMLYASTVIGYIDDPYEDPKRRLETILNYSMPNSDLSHSTSFSSLYQLYRQILQSCPKSSHPLMTQVLEDLVGAPSLLFKQNLPRALEILDLLLGRARGTGIRALRGLHGLLHLQTPRANTSGRQEWFVHSSFPVFLRNPQLSLEFTVNMVQGQRRLLSGCLDAMSTVTKQSVDEYHQHFALAEWPTLWISSWRYRREFLEEEYLAMVGKLLRCDLEACFLKFYQPDQPFDHWSLLPECFYIPGPSNCVVPSFFRGVYDSETLVQQAVSAILTSTEGAISLLVSQISTDDNPLIFHGFFVKNLAEYLLGFRKEDEDQKDRGPNKVIQALKKLGREKRPGFEQLVRKLKGLLSPSFRRSSLIEVINYIRSDVC